MRIHADGTEAANLLLYLTRPEAAELRDALNDLLDHFDEAGWHAHVSNIDEQVEVTVAPEVGPPDAP